MSLQPNKKSIIQFRWDVQKTWMKHAHMARLIQCGSPSCALGMGWDGITISLASRLHKAMIRGET